MFRKAAPYFLAVPFFAAVALAGSLSPSDAPATPAPAPMTQTTVSYLPCPSEDYVGPVACYWDANTRSNGAGFSLFWDGNHTHYQTAGVVACPSEDYQGLQPCYWDAEHRGNGTGHSFLWNGHGFIYTS